MTYPNPLLPGFNPDPSVVRVGEEFYLATSTFEYLPGIPIYQSTDFVTWTQVGNVATRVGQLDVERSPTGGGVYAPTLRHRDGVFHLVVTDVFGRGTLHFTSERAEGPWSDGVVFEGIDGIDPDLVWDDDGIAYLTFSGLNLNRASPAFLSHRGLLQARVDLTTSRALEEPRSIWSGDGGQFPEAPHLYHVGEWWYLVIAEGGTERGHAVSVARSTSPEGPFESAPHNPLVTARGTGRPIQNTGHGDLVLGPDDQWLLVLLGVRPRSITRAFSALGREAFVTTVEWHEGWPVIEPVILSPREGVVSYRDDFDEPEFDVAWMSVRRLPESIAALEDGHLVLRADGSTLSDLRPIFVGRRQQHQTATATIALDVASGVGGIAVRYDEKSHYSITAGGGKIVATAIIPGFEKAAEIPLTATQLELELSSRRPGGDPLEMRTSDLISLTAIVDGARTVLLEVEGHYLSSEVAESFTGRVFGMFALEGQVAIDWLSYEGSDE